MKHIKLMAIAFMICTIGVMQAKQIKFINKSGNPLHGCKVAFGKPESKELMYIESFFNTPLTHKIITVPNGATYFYITDPYDNRLTKNVAIPNSTAPTVSQFTIEISARYNNIYISQVVEISK